MDFPLHYPNCWFTLSFCYTCLCQVTFTLSELSLECCTRMLCFCNVQARHQALHYSCCASSIYLDLNWYIIICFTWFILYCFLKFLSSLESNINAKYKVVQIWPGLFVCKQVTVCPGHIWTTLYIILFLIYITRQVTDISWPQTANVQMHSCACPKTVSTWQTTV
jgi:hypothetical protein